MGETEALKFLADKFKTTCGGVLIGIGDDSAVMELSRRSCLVASTDTLVEDVHFRMRNSTPRQIGSKAVCVSASDIGAMGAVPRYLLCSVGCRGGISKEFIENLSEGVAEACAKFEISVVGGNLSGSETIFINMTVLGEVERGSIVLRNGAACGDDIYVTGTLGDSSLGLAALSGGGESGEYEKMISRHLDPTPRLAAGRMLGQRRLASSMIDVSDGLFRDLEKLTSEHGLGAEVGLAHIPLSEDFLSLSGRFCEDPYIFAVSGGEDYELLFTSAADNFSAVEEVSRLCGVAISKIGSVTSRRGIRFINSEGEEVFYRNGGFEHFG